MESRGGSASHHLAPVPDPEPTRPPTGISILPPEIRTSIWEQAIIDGRILQPRGRFDSVKSKWVLWFPRTRQHSLTQVCQETRKFMLGNGDFIFGKDPTEPGLWWSANFDTLLFTHNWDLRFEWNALEGLQGLNKVKSVIIDQDLARWISYHDIRKEDDPEYDPNNVSPDSLEQPIGFRFCYPDDSPDFKLLKESGAVPYHVDFDIDAFPNQAVHFDFLNDEVAEVERKLTQLRSLWRQSKQNQPDRNVANIDLLMMDTLDEAGPQFRKGASCEEMGGFGKEGEHVDVTLLTFFKDMEED